MIRSLLTLSVSVLAYTVHNVYVKLLNNRGIQEYNQFLIINILTRIACSN